MWRAFALLAILMTVSALPVPMALAQGGSPAGGTCPEFNGKDSFLRVEAGKLVDGRVENVTVEAWIYLRSFPDAEEGWVIAGKPGSFELQVIQPDPSHAPGVPVALAFAFHTNGLAPAGKVGTKWDGSVSWWGIPMGINEWHHVSASFNTSSDVAGLSIDGNLRTSRAISDAGDLVYTRSPFYIGGVSGQEGSYFDGFIDEVRVSSIVRYRNSFKLPVGFFEADNNTLALWHFDRDRGFYADSSDNGNALAGKGVGFLPVELAGRLSVTWAGIKSGR